MTIVRPMASSDERANEECDEHWRAWKRAPCGSSISKTGDVRIPVSLFSFTYGRQRHDISSQVSMTAMYAQVSRSFLTIAMNFVATPASPWLAFAVASR